MRNVLLLISRGVLLGLVLSLALAAPLAAQTAPTEQASTIAEAAAPPELGLAIVEDPLVGPGLVTASPCPTQRNARQFVEEGYLLKVTGRCTETSVLAGVAQRAEGLDVPDGEIRLEVRPIRGIERAQFRLWFRYQTDGGYFAAYEPAAGSLQLWRWGGGEPVLLAERRDLGELIVPTEWTALAVRLHGPELWLLVDDQPLISASDSTYDGGAIYLASYRLGEVGDSQEVAMVVRNLRVSSLAEADITRAPIYQGPTSIGASAPGRSAAPAPAGDSWVGDVAFGYQVSGSGAVASGEKVPIVPGGTLYAFYAWRNVPSGSKIKVEIRRDKEVFHVHAFAPANPQGRGGIGLVKWEQPRREGSAFRPNVIVFEVVLYLNDREMSRGWIQPGG